MKVENVGLNILVEFWESCLNLGTLFTFFWFEEHANTQASTLLSHRTDCESENNFNFLFTILNFFSKKRTFKTTFL